MVRTYARGEGSRTYVDYSRESLQDAVEAVRTKQLSYRKAACQFKIPLGTLRIRVKLDSVNRPGHPTVPVQSQWGAPKNTEHASCVITAIVGIVFGGDVFECTRSEATGEATRVEKACSRPRQKYLPKWSKTLPPGGHVVLHNLCNSKSVYSSLPAKVRLVVVVL